MSKAAFVGLIIVVGSALFVNVSVAVAQEQESGAVPEGTIAGVTNPYFPLEPGASRRYEGQQTDPESGETIDNVVHERVSPVPAEVAGVPVTVLRVHEYENGQLTEATSDYHVQGPDGTVYYLGEDVDKYENGQLVSHDGAWLAGEGANRAGEFMPAEPMVGMRFAQEQAPGVAQDISTVVATGLTMETPAGAFEDCIKTQDLNPLDQSIEHKYYCPGVGLVREEGAHGTLELVSILGG